MSEEEKNVTNEEVVMTETEAAPAEGQAVESAEAVYTSPYKNGFVKKLDNYFEIGKRKSNFRTEIIAGLTTFFALCYIVIVNPSSIDGAGMFPDIWNAVYVGGLIAAVIGTLLMAFVAKMPFAQAAGMGLNSFFFVSFLVPLLGSSQEEAMKGYQAGLVIIFLSGLLFLILSVTKLREKIAKAMPDTLKKAIPAGIGLFIALIGLKNAGIVVDNQFTFVALGDMSVWANAAPMLAAFIGLVTMVVLSLLKDKASGKISSKVCNFLAKGNILIGIIFAAILYYFFTWQAPVWNMTKVGETFTAFGKYALPALFKGESWANAFSVQYVGGIFSAISLIITFCLVDMFDTVGTLYGTAAEADMLDENGDPQRLNECMLCDSIATAAGSVLGTSTVTTFVESAAGVASGGRTGFTSVITALCLAICLFLSPLASIIPGAATAPALIYVGVLMLKNFSKVDMRDLKNAVPAFLTLVMMPLTYSISNGIGIGAISYVLINFALLLINVCTRKITSTEFTDGLKSMIVVTIIAVLFALRFALVPM